MTITQTRRSSATNATRGAKVRKNLVPPPEPLGADEDCPAHFSPAEIDARVNFWCRKAGR